MAPAPPAPGPPTPHLHQLILLPRPSGRPWAAAQLGHFDRYSLGATGRAEDGAVRAVLDQGPLHDGAVD